MGAAEVEAGPAVIKRIPDLWFRPEVPERLGQLGLLGQLDQLEADL